MNKVLFLHPTVHNIDEMLKYLCIANPRIKENVIWEKNNPDIVFVSEVIFTIPKYFTLFKKLYNSHDGRIYIFHGGESVYPDLNIFDYSLGYCTYLMEFDRVIKIPEQIFFFHENRSFINNFDEESALQSLKGRDFCNFIYSNPFAHPNRDKFFYELGKYKKVSSLGSHLNNTKNLHGRNHTNWLEDSINLKSKYKFSIAFENEVFSGYTTEKLLSSFKAHTVPIYWGNPKINDYYNSRAFINCHDYSKFDEVVDKIKEIDNNDDLWAAIVSQPWQTQEQKERTHVDEKKYNNFIYGLLLANDLSEYFRRPIGTWTELYNKWFFRSYKKSRIDRAIGRIKRYKLQ